MIEVRTVKEPDGWRVAITDGRQTIVLEDIFEDEVQARLSAANLI
ncbi:MAG: hypothetical protein JWO96_133 [Candidatus Saccharibacteria bacterium]|nr:hypothetical protein [Candidatus Saccharibacteria bacterium]